MNKDSIEMELIRKMNEYIKEQTTKKDNCVQQEGKDELCTPDMLENRGKLTNNNFKYTIALCNLKLHLNNVTKLIDSYLTKIEDGFSDVEALWDCVSNELRELYNEESSRTNYNMKITK